MPFHWFLPLYLEYQMIDHMFDVYMDIYMAHKAEKIIFNLFTEFLTKDECSSTPSDTPDYER